MRSSQDVEDDIEEMRAEEVAQRAEAKITMWELIRSPTLRLPLVIAIVMQLSQQLSGINAVFYYSTNLFMTTGKTFEVNNTFTKQHTHNNATADEILIEKHICPLTPRPVFPLGGVMPIPSLQIFMLINMVGVLF